MSLIAGTRLGPYEITSAIGAGGMGEVYRARDSKLNRDVAIKVLPELFASDSERLVRFEREAQTLAALNHPNIAQVFGVLEAPAALVMEFVDGEDLSQRIARGPIAVDEALTLARQIADALEAAHERGIIHRDLKPANIKVREDGAIKVLDFGLAKAVAQGLTGVAQGFSPADTGSPEGLRYGLENSPTCASPAMTEMGMVLGTAAYMSPEQARGKPVDRRADIWAFGCVVYEMVTGRPAFPGETTSDVVAAILTRECDLSAVPSRLQRLVRRCLEKDPARRLRDIGDFELLLEEAPVFSQRPNARTRMAWIIAACATVGAVFAIAAWARSSPGDAATTRLTIALPSGQELTDHAAITPDGKTIAYTASEGGREPRLFLRDLNAFEPREVTASSGATQPFFSPDSRWVAFFAQGHLQKAAIAGGAPVKLAPTTFPFGGTWNEDDTIIYVPELSSGLARVPAAGGASESLIRPDGKASGFSHTWPQALPGGRAVLFSIAGKGVSGTAVLSLDSRQWTMVLPGAGGAVFAPSGRGTAGWLLVSDESAGLKAARFDPDHPVATSAGTAVLADVYYQPDVIHSWAALSRGGTGIHIPGSPNRRSIVWVDRTGKIIETVTREPGPYLQTIPSPDGSKALVLRGPDLWIYEFSSGTRRRLTFHGDTGASTSSPMWSRDGTHVLFASNETGDSDIYTQPANGSAPAVPVLKRPFDQYPQSMAPDGTLLFGEGYPDKAEALFTRAPDGKITPLRVMPFMAVNGQFSPDGRAVAYQSNETGRFEVYVESGGRRVAVSTDGGIIPLWSRDGRELFYVGGDALMSAPVKPDGSFGAGRRLFDASSFYFFWHSYDSAADGRFLMIHRGAGSVPRQINVILNWTAELQRLLPAGQ